MLPEPVQPGPPSPPRAAWLTLLLLAVVPVAVLAASVFLERAVAVHWVGPYYDPDYQYLLNALNLTEGAAPRHTDHPGTTVQELGAAALLIRHWLSGGGSLREQVLSDPESALRAISAVLRIVYGAALLLFGWSAHRLTSSRFAAVAAQAASAVSLASIHWLWRITPEPLVMAFTLVLASITLLALANPIPRRFAALSGAAAALAVVTKVTALPALVVPAWGLIRSRRWLPFLIAFVAVALLAMAPILAQSGRMAGWFTSVALNDGRYGAGQGHLILDPRRYGFDLRRMVASEPVGPAAGALSLILLASLRISGRWRTMSERARYAAGALVCVAAAEAAQYLMVAKHPGSRYLLPGIALAGLNVALLSLLLREACTRRERIALIAIGLTLLAFHGQRVGARLIRDVRSARIDAAARTALHQRAIEETSRAGGVLITMYGSASLCFALIAADHWAGDRYRQDLARLFPDEGVFNEWTGVVRFRGEPLSRDQMRSLASEGRLFLQMYSPYPAADLEYDVLAQASTESLYRMRPPAGPPAPGPPP